MRPQVSFFLRYPIRAAIRTCARMNRSKDTSMAHSPTALSTSVKWSFRSTVCSRAKKRRQGQQRCIRHIDAQKDDHEGNVDQIDRKGKNRGEYPP